jgi:hypothetical protein
MSPISDRIFENLGPNKEIALEFLVTFSRFEHALKYSGLCKDMNDGARAKADWGKYTSELSRDAKAKIEVEAKKFLLGQPPKIQIMKQGKVSWQPADRDNRDIIVWIFDLINIVRNNLFHGGKYRESVDSEDHPNSTRDTDLVKACLSILSICLEEENTVTKAFYSGLD